MKEIPQRRGHHGLNHAGRLDGYGRDDRRDKAAIDRFDPPFRESAQKQGHQVAHVCRSGIDCTRGVIVNRVLVIEQSRPESRALVADVEADGLQILALVFSHVHCPSAAATDIERSQPGSLKVHQ